MKLFYNQTSPYARKARIALLELGIEPGAGAAVELINTDPWSDNDILLAANPVSKVPALWLNDQLTITESDQIVHALCLLFPGKGAKVWPAFDSDSSGPDLSFLARLGLAQGLIDAAFGAIIEGRRPEAKRWPDWVMRQQLAIERSIDRAASYWSPGQTPEGRFDASDISLATALAYLDFRHASIDWRSRQPALATWYERCARRPSLQQTRPD